jgi:signal transduction histidine kinase
VSPDEPDREDLLHPQPSLAAIPELVARAKAAGVDVEVGVEEPTRPVSAGSALTAYRVVQEGLTNAVRHSPNAPVTVLVAYAQNGLTVSVANAARDAPTRSMAAPGPNGGNGLVGLRDRVEADGGRLSVGPDHGGGWALRAWIPLEAVVERDP